MAHKKQDTAIRRASKLAEVAYIVPLTESESRGLVKEANGLVETAGSALDKLDVILGALHDRLGWKALGYTSWDACVQHELYMTKRRANQLIAFARVRRNLEASGNNVPTLRESQARELNKLPPGQQAEAWEQAVKESPNGKPTAKGVAAVVEQGFGKTRPAPKPGNGKSGSAERAKREQLARIAREAPIHVVQYLLTLAEAEETA